MDGLVLATRENTAAKAGLTRGRQRKRARGRGPMPSATRMAKKLNL
jgi:hypothetical protein